MPFRPTFLSVSSPRIIGERKYAFYENHREKKTRKNKNPRPARKSPRKTYIPESTNLFSFRVPLLAVRPARPLGEDSGHRGERDERMVKDKCPLDVSFLCWCKVIVPVCVSWVFLCTQKKFFSQKSWTFLRDECYFPCSGHPWRAPPTNRAHRPAQHGRTAQWTRIAKVRGKIARIRSERVHRIHRFSSFLSNFSA